MLDKLIHEDREKIVNYINQYSDSNKKITINNLNYLLREWNKQKKSIYEKFNNNFIIEKEISIQNSSNIIKYDIENIFLNNTECHILRGNILKFFYNYDNENHTFFSDNIGVLLSPETLSKNKYEGKDFKIYNAKTKKYIQIQHGCKPLKALQKISLSFNICSEQEFKNFRDKISTFLNVKEIKGIMCLSIHPLDYMTMSDNSNDWSSCMSWIESGCYRQGTIEMMNSPFVVVGYLKSLDDKNDKFNNMWNSKKWRELYIVNLKDELIVNIKSYPYKLDVLSKMNVEWLQEIFLPNNEIYESNSRYIVNTNKNKVFELSVSTNHMYNDFDNSYTLFCSINPDSERKVYNFNYSGKSECMYCGELDPYFDKDENLCCTDCCSYLSCCDCGCTMDKESMYQIDEFTYVCEHCYNSFYFKCPYDGQIYSQDYGTIILIEDENQETIDSFMVYEDNLKYFLDEFMLDKKQGEKYHNREINSIKVSDFDLDKFEKVRADY